MLRYICFAAHSVCSLLGLSRRFPLICGRCPHVYAFLFTGMPALLLAPEAAAHPAVVAGEGEEVDRADQEAGAADERLACISACIPVMSLAVSFQARCYIPFFFVHVNLYRTLLLVNGIVAFCGCFL